MWENFIWSVVFGVPLATGWVAMSLNPPEFAVARAGFIVASLVLLGRIGWWITVEHQFANKYLTVILFTLVFSFVGFLLSCGLQWIGTRESISIKPGELKNNSQSDIKLSIAALYIFVPKQSALLTGIILKTRVWNAGEKSDTVAAWKLYVATSGSSPVLAQMTIAPENITVCDPQGHSLTFTPKDFSLEQETISKSIEPKGVPIVSHLLFYVKLPSKKVIEKNTTLTLVVEDTAGHVVSVSKRIGDIITDQELSSKPISPVQQKQMGHNPKLETNKSKLQIQIQPSVNSSYKYPLQEYSLWITNPNFSPIVDCMIEFFFKDTLVKVEAWPVLKNAGPGRVEFHNKKEDGSEVVYKEQPKMPDFCSLTIHQGEINNQTVNTNVLEFNCQRWPRNVFAFSANLLTDSSKELSPKRGPTGYRGTYFYESGGQTLTEKISGSMPEISDRQTK